VELNQDSLRSLDLVESQLTLDSTMGLLLIDREFWIHTYVLHVFERHQIMEERGKRNVSGAYQVIWA